MPNKMFTRIMFHITHEDNVPNIFNIGVSPEFSKGKRKAIWFVPKVAIQSGILHVAARHHWDVERLHVVTILPESEHIKFSGNGMLFYSEHIAIAESHAPAYHFLDEMEQI